MKENDVKFFSTLLNIEAGDVEGAITDGTLGEKFTALGLLNKSQVEALKVNLTKEVRGSHIPELVEAAKRGELDKDLYKVIKGASLEMLEKDLSKEYKVYEYDDVKDLIAKISNRAAKPDDKLIELNETLKALKEVNKNLVTEKDDAVQAARMDYEGKLLTRSKNDLLGEVPFDFSDVEDSDLEKTANSRKMILGSVFDARFNLKFDGDKVIVTDKEGTPLTNSATLDSLPALDVLKTLASELGQKLQSPETGGQGGKSSGGKGGAKFATESDFYNHLEANSISPTSNEGLKLFAESGLAAAK
ncbi:MAG: hypothetical protein DRQ89_13125 [Epsilonproteobacteria bacterium]|nr:MAG: hypothetical protein DRQ89_13125 [Campylobacterota bacterium]